MEKIKHPKKLYIQISDEDEYNIGFGFTDDIENPRSLDYNEFDQATKERVLRILSLSCRFFNDYIDGRVPYLNNSKE